MKNRLVVFLSPFVAAWCFASDMPEQVTLTSGAVLRKPSVVRWESSQVVLKHAGGIGPVRFTAIVPEDLSKLKAAWEAKLKAEQEVRRDEYKAPAADTAKIEGQVFVQTRGAGTYKFGGATVFAYDLKEYDSAFDRQKGNLFGYRGAVGYRIVEIEKDAWFKALRDVKPLAVTQTDGDGKFALSVPAKAAAFLVCHTCRIAGREEEHNLWVLPVSGTTMILSATNQWQQLD